MADRNSLIELNKQQKAYYESRFEAAGGDERAANRLTNLWTRLRRRIQRHDERIALREAVLADHQQWLGDIQGKRVLDFGCFSGNDLSLWLAEKAGDYYGMDLSEHAVAELHAKLEARGLTDHATAQAGDILANDFPSGHFDIVYAHSVLHHFSNISLVLAELHRLLRPGGIVVAVDPLATEPLNRFARLCYRPFQSDRDWEWPFKAATFRRMEEYFDLDRVQGYRGFAMAAFPLALIPFLEPVARGAGRLGMRLDHRLARRRGPFLGLCWLVSTRLVKPIPRDAEAPVFTGEDG